VESNLENLGCNQEESSVVDTYATSLLNFTLHWLISVKEQRTWRLQWRCAESSHHFHSDVLCKKVPSALLSQEVEIVCVARSCGELQGRSLQSGSWILKIFYLILEMR
jgi:hypothetical protein